MKNTDTLVAKFVANAAAGHFVAGKTQLFGFEVCGSLSYRTAVIKRLAREGWVQRTEAGMYLVLRDGTEIQ